MGEREREESFEAYPETVLAFEGGPRIELRWQLDSDITTLLQSSLLQ